MVSPKFKEREKDDISKTIAEIEERIEGKKAFISKRSFSTPVLRKPKKSVRMSAEKLAAALESPRMAHKKVNEWIFEVR